MKELDLSVEILNAVLDGTEFGTALKDKFQKEVEIRPLRHDVASLVGCALRHSILFTRLLDKVEGLEESDKRIVMIGMANNYFCRRYEKKDMDEAIKGLLGEEKLAIALPILDKEGEENRYMPDDVDHSSLDYLSLRYNAPIWACKILHHFGYSNTFKTLKKWARPYVTYVRFRDLPELESLRTSPDFAATSVKDVYLYAGKKPLRVYEEYRRGKIFEVRPRVKELLDSHVIASPSSALLYCGKLSGGAELELVEHYGDALAMNIATSELDSKLALTRLIREKGLHNVNLFQTTDPTSMDASVPGKQQLVVCLPDSTAFDQVPTSPDFLLHFDKDAMDGIISGEQKALEGCAKYVDDGGKLIYAILTISKKEGHLAVESFLQNHQEFTLVEEKQCFPYDELGTAVYYAVLSRGAEVDKIPAPLGELSALKEMSSPCAAAKAE